MKLSEFKKIVETVDNLSFELPNGEFVPSHYHVTEVGSVTKNFIDCGGTIREERNVNFQLWYSNDVDHHLKPQRLLDIINLSESKLNLQDGEIEVEYQMDTIGKFGMDYNGKNFVLVSKSTDCLALDECAVPAKKTKIDLSDMVTSTNGCSPDGGCC